MIKRLFILVLVVVALGGCATDGYTSQYQAYVAASAAAPQKKVVEFVDSGGKPVTVYSDKGSGIAPPSEKEHPIWRVVDKGLNVLGGWGIAREVRIGVSELAGKSGSQVNVNADNGAQVGVGDGNFSNPGGDLVKIIGNENFSTPGGDLNRVDGNDNLSPQTTTNATDATTDGGGDNNL